MRMLTSTGLVILSLSEKGLPFTLIFMEMQAYSTNTGGADHSSCLIWVIWQTFSTFDSMIDSVYAISQLLRKGKKNVSQGRDRDPSSFPVMYNIVFSVMD